MKNEGELHRLLFKDRTPLLSVAKAKQSEVTPLVAPTGAPVKHINCLFLDIKNIARGPNVTR
jgi:hypothetical protein